MTLTSCAKSLRILVFATVLAGAQSAFAQESAADLGSALRARSVALTEALETSTIQKGLFVESAESSQSPRGDAYAIVNYPFASVASAFTTPAFLCESLILHLNVQYCRATGAEGSAVLSVALGKKTNQPLEDTHQIKLKFKAETASADYLRVELSAKEGPLGTGNYLIAMELIALDDQRKHGIAKLTTSAPHTTVELFIGKGCRHPRNSCSTISTVVAYSTMRMILALDNATSRGYFINIMIIKQHCVDKVSNSLVKFS